MKEVEIGEAVEPVHRKDGLVYGAVAIDPHVLDALPYEERRKRLYETLMLLYGRLRSELGV